MLEKMLLENAGPHAVTFLIIVSEKIRNIGLSLVRQAKRYAKPIQQV
jgi:hypothetical protein